jgi:hypothetical protein
MEPGINLSVVAGDPSKIQEHPTNARRTEKQENSDRVSQGCSGLRVIENADKTDEAPKKGKAYWYSPKQERSSVPARIWRRRCLRRIRLGRPRMESGGVCVCALLIEDGRSHDVRGSALVALIRVQLRYGCHAVVHELATACAPGSSIEILARFLQIVPTLQKTEIQSWIAPVGEPLQSIGDRPMAHPGPTNSFDRV